LARTPVIDVSKIALTKHSIERFTERYKEMHPKTTLEKPVRTLKEYLSRAVPDDKISKRKKKRMVAKYGPQILLRLRGWRFVLMEDEGVFRLITVIATAKKR
jgi:hypothetical protein